MIYCNFCKLVGLKIAAILPPTTYLATKNDKKKSRETFATSISTRIFCAQLLVNLAIARLA